MITLQEITLQRSQKILLENINASFFSKQKVGIVGKNGCGKTSLFLMLLGELESKTGDVLLQADLRMVTIEQEIPNSDKPVIEYVIDADITLRKCQCDLTKAEENHEGNKIAEIYATLQDIDGFTANARAARILDGLGFTDEIFEKSVNALSGGWRMRLNIARALFVPSDVLLLDEPTNHLDLDAVIWLEKWLLKYPGLLFVISHDRELLDKIATHIAHIEHKKLRIYTGNYSNFEKQRIADLALQQKQYEKQKKQIDHIESFIKRFKAKASKARQAQSRVKALEKMQQIMPAYVDSPFDFEFKKPKSLSNPLLTLVDVVFEYEQNPILENINFQLNVGDRIGLLGKNGAGKSTFIKILAGELEPVCGSSIKNSNVNIGYFAQHSLETLDENLTALQHLRNIEKSTNELTLRKFLGGFDFSGDASLMPVKNFSGGEKARLALALIVWKAPNVLLLDEPTNHLDIDMRQALVLALQNYSGAVIVISHDRFLLSQVVDEYYLIANKHIHKFVEGLEGYEEWLASEKSFTNLEEMKNRKEQQLENKLQKSAKKKEVLVVSVQVKNLEKRIVTLQNEVLNIDHDLVELSHNAKNKVNEIINLHKKRDEIERQLEVTEHEWIEKNEYLEYLTSQDECS